MLIAHHITKRFGDRIALDNVSVSLDRGEIVALVGPSGCGKTTLLRSLALLPPPDTGTICIGECEYRPPYRNVRVSPPWPLLTFVSQELDIWPHLSLRENILLPVRNKSSPDKAPLFIEALAERFSMTGLLDKMPHETSLGERQRAALMRAIVLESTYLLLDEITSALDVERVGIVGDYLLEMKKRKNVGILIVTHLLGLARRIADRVIFMDAGVICETARTQQFFSTSNERIVRFLALII